MAPQRNNTFIKTICRNKLLITILLILSITVFSQMYLDIILDTILDTSPDLHTPDLDLDPPDFNPPDLDIPPQTVITPLMQRTIPTNKHCRNPYITNEYNSSYGKYERLNVSKLPNNLIHFVNRCQFHKFFKNSHGDFDSLWMNSKIGYSHNYKCGGSSIQYALFELSKKDLKGDFLWKDSRRGSINLFVSNPKFMNESKWSDDNHHFWFQKLTEMFLFTFVRDPIDRFLSSFYEVHTRNHSQNRIWNRLGVDQYTGIDRLRKLLQVYKEHIYKNLHARGRIHEFGFKKQPISVNYIWKGEHHFHPQTLFLLTEDFKYLPFDYIGDIKYFDQALKMIFDEFSDYFHKNPDKYDEFVRHRRAREVDNKKNIDKGSFKKRGNYKNVENKEYYIKREELSDEDINLICEVYWIDYMCIPFEIPKQCNIQRLFNRYYDKFVTYNDCYFS